MAQNKEHHLPGFLAGLAIAGHLEKDSINVKRIYIDINDGILSDGIMFSQIMFWWGEDKLGKSKLRVFKEGDFWMAKRNEDWWNECRVSEKQARDSLKRMKAKGFLTVKVFRFNGSPTVHIKLNKDIVSLAIIQQLEKQSLEPSVHHVLPSRSNPNDSEGKTKRPEGQNQLAPEGRSLTETTNKDYLTEITHTSKSGTENTCVCEPEKAYFTFSEQEQEEEVGSERKLEQPQCTPTSVDSKTEIPRVANKLSSVDQSSAAAPPLPEKRRREPMVAKKEEWVCPQQELRIEFLRWRSKRMGKEGTITMASNWCNKRPQAANDSFVEFLESRQPKPLPDTLL